MRDFLIILIVIAGWLLLFIILSTLAVTIQDKREIKRERKILEEYEKEFD